MEYKSTYRIGKLIPGWKIGPEFKGRILIAVNSRKEFPCKVMYKGEWMIADLDEKIHTVKDMQDKFGRMDTYDLYFWYWEPINETQMVMGGI